MWYKTKQGLTIDDIIVKAKQDLKYCKEGITENSPNKKTLVNVRIPKLEQFIKILSGNIKKMEHRKGCIMWNPEYLILDLNDIILTDLYLNNKKIGFKIDMLDKLFDHMNITVEQWLFGDNN